MTKFRQALIYTLIAELVLAALVGGVRLRHWVWDACAECRQSQDIANGWGWGERALKHGVVGLYQHVIDSRPDGDYDFDYSPLRLVVVTVWARWTNWKFAGAQAWQPGYAFSAPLLWLNTLMELAGAVGIFMVVRRWCVAVDLRPAEMNEGRGWLERLAGAITGMRAKPVAGKVRHAAAPMERKPFHGVGRGLLAAMLFWMNPAMLLDAHGWPQWDVWPVPFLIFALYAAMGERWFWTGALLAVGAMFKGQVLLVAPFFVLWPLLANAPRAVFGVLVGFLFTAALIASPWLIGGGALWVAGVALTPAIVRRSWFGKRPIASEWITVPIAIELVLWPMVRVENRAWLPVAVLIMLAAGLIWMGRRMGGRWLGVQIALAVGVSLFLCPVLFDGSMAWYRLGFRYGANKFQEMTVGAENLAAILERSFGVTTGTGVWRISLPAFYVDALVTVKHVMLAGYFLSLALCAMAACGHARRVNANLLVAAVGPWVMLFALLSQMHERYLVWGAALSAMWVGAGLGMTLLHLLITAVATLEIGHVMLTGHPDVWARGARFAEAATPGMGWVVLVLAGVVGVGMWGRTTRRLVQGPG